MCNSVCDGLECHSYLWVVVVSGVCSIAQQVCEGAIGLNNNNNTLYMSTTRFAIILIIINTVLQLTILYVLWKSCYDTRRTH